MPNRGYLLPHELSQSGDGREPLAKGISGLYLESNLTMFSAHLVHVALVGLVPDGVILRVQAFRVEIARHVAVLEPAYREEIAQARPDHLGGMHGLPRAWSDGHAGVHGVASQRRRLCSRKTCATTELAFAFTLPPCVFLLLD